MREKIDRASGKAIGRTMFDPSKLGTKSDMKETQRRVAGWASEAMPSVVRSAMLKSPQHCSISAREVNCTDPDCAPIDTCFIFVFENGRKCAAALPGAFTEIKREDVYHAVLSKAEALLACHEDRALPAPPEKRPSGMPDDAWWYVSFGFVTALTATRVKHWRGPEDALAAALAAAGGSLLLYATGLYAAVQYKRRFTNRDPERARTFALRSSAKGKRAKYSEFGHRTLKGCPCCDPSFDDDFR